MWNPLGDAAQVNHTTSSWQAEPNRRGTYSILSSCLITMGLCVWTALHLNIPKHKQGAAGRFWYKVGWLLLGLLAPEIVAFTALQQWHEARKFGDRMSQSLGQTSSPSKWKVSLRRFWDRTSREDLEGESFEVPLLSPPLQQPHRTSQYEGRLWTKVHTYYALMGGFAIDTDVHTENKSQSDLENFLPEKRTRLTLTKEGILLLVNLEPALLPYVSEEAIRDKSKASTFAQTFVCLQAIWFCFQCITRLAFHLPICLLELNTFAHAICALLVYALWWDKPSDIEEPTLLPASDGRSRSLFAFMCMSSEIGFLRKCSLSDAHKTRKWGHYYGFVELRRRHQQTSSLHAEDGVHGDDTIQDDIDSITADTSTLPRASSVNSPRTSISESEGANRRSENGNLRIDKSIPDIHKSSVELKDYWFEDDSDSEVATEAMQNASGIVRLKKDQKFESIYFKHCYRRWPLRNECDPSHPVYIQLEKTDLYCFSLAREGSQRYRLPLISYRNLQLRHTYRYSRLNQIDYLVTQISDWPSFDRILDDTTQQYFLHGFALSGLVYSGIHLLAWDAPFATRAEVILLRISSVAIAAPGVYMLGIGVILVIGYLVRSVLRKMWALVHCKTAFGGVFSDLLGTALEKLWQTIIYILLLIALVTYHVGTGLLHIVYFLARAYIVVECFVSLTYLPDAVFDLPQWPVYVPHIS